MRLRSVSAQARHESSIIAVTAAKIQLEAVLSIFLAGFLQSSFCLKPFHLISAQTIGVGGDIGGGGHEKKLHRQNRCL